MFGKLLKYDMKAVFRIYKIFPILLPVIALTAAFVIRLMDATMQNDDLIFLTVLCVFYLVLCYLALLASVVLIPILIFARFYQNFFTDEGYLTFTLPVRRQTLLMSKTVNALLFSVIHALLVTVCLLIVGIIAPVGENGAFFDPIVFETIADVIYSAEKALGGWMYLYGLMILLVILSCTVFAIVLIHFCITIAATTVRRGRLILGIGIYYAANNVVSFTVQAFVFIGTWLTADGLSAVTAGMGLTESHLAILLMLLMFCLATAALTAILYCITLGRLERKLNLS